MFTALSSYHARKTSFDASTVPRETLCNFSCTSLCLLMFQDRELRQGELWEQCCSRRTEMEAALNALHFVRQLSQLHADTAQVITHTDT